VVLTTGWTASVRSNSLQLLDPFPFSELRLAEVYGPPDSMTITGDISDLREAFSPDSGVLVVDQNGKQRFSGMPPKPPKSKIERRGDGTATLTFESDTVVLWDRYCWPTPANHWTAQTSPYDVQTAVNETRILGFIARNAGSSAYNGTAGGVTIDRRVPHLRIPSSGGRGTSGKTSARFQNLGQLVADLAEAAGLRVIVKQTYDPDGTPYLDVVVSAVPDLSDDIVFGDANEGDLGILDQGWRYAIGPGVTAVLSAAGGQLENRLLTASVDSSRKAAWGRHIEMFLDQRGTTDTGEIAQALAQAMAENAPTVEVEAPLTDGDLTFGPGTGSIPVGAKVAVSLDGELVKDRIRGLNTTVTAAEGQATVTTEAIFGSLDAPLTIDQKRLRRAARRIENLEISQ
jgi:hypothetical protein